MTLVDTNVILDILGSNPTWLGWSTDQLESCADAGPLLINEITYAELSARLTSEAVLQSALGEMGIALERTPTAALFLAGRTFNRYRTAGGTRSSVLPDFFIGAHAAVSGTAILTRDIRRFRTYFPKVVLIAPEMPPD